jgi:hypothetical protein
MVLHFKNVRGLHHDGRGPAAAPLPVQDPDQGQVNGAGFRPDEIAKLPVSGAFKFESVTPAASAFGTQPN